MPALALCLTCSISIWLTYRVNYLCSFVIVFTRFLVKINFAKFPLWFFLVLALVPLSLLLPNVNTDLFHTFISQIFLDLLLLMYILHRCSIIVISKSNKNVTPPIEISLCLYELLHLNEEQKLHTRETPSLTKIVGIVRYCCMNGWRESGKMKMKKNEDERGKIVAATKIR